MRNAFTTDLDDPKVQPAKKASKAEAIAPEVKRLREDDGLSLTAIANMVGVSTATVHAAAKRAGVRFDADSTRALTETHLAGSRLKRAKLAVKLLDIAEDRLNRVIDADAVDGKNYILTAAVALDKHAALEGREREDHDLARREERIPQIVRDLEAIGL
jgi:hypothetical protein